MRTSLAALPLVLAGLVACGDDESSSAGGGGSTSATSTSATTTTTSPASSSASSGGEGAAGGGSASSSSSGTAGGDTSSGGAGGGDTGGGDTGGAGGGEGGSGGSGGGFTVCDDYPVALTFPDTQAAAEAELAELSPDAQMDWVSVFGTFSNISSFLVPLDCEGHGGDAWDAAWALFEEHPDLFQLDRSEWDDTTTYPCSSVTELRITTTARDRLAGEFVQEDGLSLFLAPGQDGGVVLQAVSGRYLPVLADGALTACEPQRDRILADAARAHTYPYATFDLCEQTGSEIYEPTDDDEVVLGETWWTWDDDGTTVHARQWQAATLILDPSNVDADIEASNANCPADDDGVERIYGFSLILDPVTGEVLEAIPGVGCVVCLD